GREEKGVWIRVDGGEGYDPSTAGFINRQVRAVLADKTERGRVYAGVIFDRVSGGLFVSEDGGITWRQSMSGMGIRDVYSLYQSDSSPATIYAGTNQGLFRSDDHGLTWTQVKKEAPKEPGEDPSKPPTAQAASEGEAAVAEKVPVKPVVRTSSNSTSQKGRPQVNAGGKSRSRRGSSASRSKPKKAKPQPPVPEENKLVDLQNQVFAILPLIPLNA